MPHICFDELRLLVAAIVIATPWLGWLRSWWHHRRRHGDCLGGLVGGGDGLAGGETAMMETRR
jgi:hypothetical protein